MTNKTRNTILITSYIVMDVITSGMFIYYVCFHEDDWRWAIGTGVLFFALFFLWMDVLPRFLEMRVDNHHKVVSRNERLVLNGKERIAGYICSLAAVFVLMFSFGVWQSYHYHPTVSAWRAIGLGLFYAIFFMGGLSPMFGDVLYRRIKNTYTIEGCNLIIDEWAWFRKKTDHLVIPISEIESIRKRNAGLVQTCNIEIQVRGIKRVLATGVVGDQLYDALKERMA